MLSCAGSFSSRGRPLVKSSRHAELHSHSHAMHDEQDASPALDPFQTRPASRYAEHYNYHESDSEADHSWNQTSQQHMLEEPFPGVGKRRHAASRSVSPFNQAQSLSPGENSFHTVRTRTRTIRRPPPRD